MQGETLIICDSTCDLSYIQEEKYDLRILNCLVELDGLPYEERVDINAAKVYEYVEKTGNMPHHAQITVIRFVEEYMKAARDGYENIICVTMNREGSGTYSSACHGIEMLTAEYPALEGKLNIRVVDSGTYSVGICQGLLLGVRALQKGEDFNRAADIMEDYFNNQMTLVGLFSLQYAKKSGRLNAAAAIIGDALGIKPILGIKGFNKVVGKVRGDKNLLPKVAQMYFDMAEDPIHGDYSIAYGDDVETGKKLAALIKKQGGKSPQFINPIGTCVGINAGPKMAGLAFRTKADFKI